MPNHAGVLQSLFFPAKLETEGDGSIFNTLLGALMLLIEVGLVSNCVAVQRSAASLFPMFDLRPRTAVDGRTETSSSHLRGSAASRLRLSRPDPLPPLGFEESCRST